MEKRRAKLWGTRWGFFSDKAFSLERENMQGKGERERGDNMLHKVHELSSEIVVTIRNFRHIKTGLLWHVVWPLNAIRNLRVSVGLVCGAQDRVHVLCEGSICERIGVRRVSMRFCWFLVCTWTYVLFSTVLKHHVRVRQFIWRHFIGHKSVWLSRVLNRHHHGRRWHPFRPEAQERRC